MSGHYLAIPMCAYNKQKSFTMEDAEMPHAIGHLRIYIEQAFRRIREFKMFRKQVKLSQLDLIGKVFSVCALLTNFQALLKKDPTDPYIRSWRGFGVWVGGIHEGLLEERIFRVLKKLFLFFLLGKLNFWLQKP